MKRHVGSSGEQLVLSLSLDAWLSILMYLVCSWNTWLAACFFLNNQRKDFWHKRQRIHHQNLSTGLSIGLSEPHEEFQSILRLLKIYPQFYSSTIENRHRLTFFEFIPKNFQFGEVAMTSRDPWLRAINCFLIWKIWGPLLWWKWSQR